MRQGKFARAHGVLTVRVAHQFWHAVVRIQRPQFGHPVWVVVVVGVRPHPLVLVMCMKWLSRSLCGHVGLYLIYCTILVIPLFFSNHTVCDWRYLVLIIVVY
jgi:hypothetical protein